METMLLNAQYFNEKHGAGLSYQDYLASGSDEHRGKWSQVYDQAKLTDDQQQLIAGFTRRIIVIGLSGIWCGDCIQQGPLVQKIADANPQSIDLRWLDRDEHADLQEQVCINAGNRVPLFFFCAEDYEPVTWFGDRTLSRYRAMAAKQLGDECPLLGAEIASDQMSAAISDWVQEFERVHLLLRLSGRLRQLHGD